MINNSNATGLPRTFFFGITVLVLQQICFKYVAFDFFVIMIVTVIQNLNFTQVNFSE